TQTDRYVGKAANHGVSALPILFATPGWLSDSYIKAPVFSSEARAAWRRFVHAAVARYGPNGSFWAEHPQVAYLPVRDWQIWNEENSPGFYAPAPSPSSYDRLLGISATVIRRLDPGARIVLGGMFEGGRAAG